MNFFGEAHDELEVKGQVVDWFGKSIGSFKDNKIFDKGGKHVASIRGHFLVDTRGKRIEDLNKIRKQVNQDSVDTVFAALWLLSKEIK